MALEHQNLRFQYCLIAQREMDGHLVTVEVGVERRTCQRVQLDSLTFDELWLESLYTEAVQCRGTVQHDRMPFHDVFKDVPDNRLATINNLLGALDGFHDATLDEFADDERLVKLSCHQLRQTAFAHPQLRTNNDYRTCRIVNTLTEEVLTETALFALQRVGERLQRTVALTFHCRRLAAIVEQ